VRAGPAVVTEDTVEVPVSMGGRRHVTTYRLPEGPSPPPLDPCLPVALLPAMRLGQRRARPLPTFPPLDLVDVSSLVPPPVNHPRSWERTLPAARAKGDAAPAAAIEPSLANRRRTGPRSVLRLLRPARGW
jgi:hypothetical protein